MEIQFFSPPHVVQVKDTNYRRRNSLPSYVSLGNNDNVKTQEKETIVAAAESNNNSLTSSSTSSLNGKLQTMSDIMNKVVQETNELNTHPPNGSPLQIRSLVCSPYVSPKKRFPKFVFSSDENQHPQSPIQFQSTPVFSLDTAKETFNASPPNESGGLGLETPQMDISSNKIIEVSLDDGKTEIRQPIDVVSDEHTELPSTEDKSLDKDEETALVPQVTEVIQAVAIQPTSLKKVAQHVRTSSPLLEEEETTSIGDDEEILVIETEHIFVRKEEFSPCVSPIQDGTPVSEVEYSPITVSPMVDETSERTSHSISPTTEKTSDLQSDKEIQKPPTAEANDIKLHNVDERSSEMDLMDSFTSYRDSTLSTGNTLTYSLVSPKRTKNLIDEATAHARRRRPSGKRTLLSKTVSESVLNFHLITNPQSMKRHTSSPLISPARHEMLIRRASDHIINNRVRRRSNQITEELAEESMTEANDSSTITPLLTCDSIEQQNETESSDKDAWQLTQSMTSESSDICDFGSGNCNVNKTV